MQLLGTRSPVRSCVPATDGFVSPSRGRGYRNTILEALASVVPVVTTADCGTRGTLWHSEVAGIRVAREDSGPIAYSLLDLLADLPDLKRRRGADGRPAHRAAGCRPTAR